MAGLWLVLSAVLGALSIAAMLPLLTAAGIGSGDAGGLGAAVAAWGLSAQAALRLPPGPAGYAVIVILVVAFNYLFFWLHARAVALLQADYVSGWQSDLIGAVLGARWPFHQRHRPGELMNVLNGEMSRLNSAFYQTAGLLSALVHVAVYVAGALLVSWPVTLIILVTGTAMIAITVPWLRRGARMGHEITRAGAELQSASSQALSAIKMIKATATEQEAATEFAAAARRLQGLNAQVTTDSQIVRAMLEIVSALLVIAILVLGPLWLGIGAAQIVIVMGLFVRIFPRLSGVQQSVQALATVIASLDAVQRLLAAALAERETASSGPLPFPQAAPVAVRLSALSITYEARTVLASLDLEIAAGECVAIVGPSGAGKSTLVDCVLGLAEPTGGQVRIAGHRLADLPLASWRRAVGYVTQDATLLNASVRDNLLWGNPGAREQDLHAALAQANAAALVASLPEGLDTLLGPQGRALSGGERQRIGLARALVGGRCLLILDEATSAQDAETEQAIIEAIRALKGRITIVMIAHRLSSVRVADRICLLEAGRIVESGTFAMLVASPSRFATLWAMQAAQSLAIGPKS
jgi:ATP-binding cassette subfamily C protein